MNRVCLVTTINNQYSCIPNHRLYLNISNRHADHPWLQNAKKAPNVPLGENVRARLKQFSVMNKFKKKALKVSFLRLSEI